MESVGTPHRREPQQSLATRKGSHVNHRQMIRLLTTLLFGCLLARSDSALAVCDPSCQTCSGATASDCTSCTTGFYLNGNPGPCTACPLINHCITTVTCTGATTSQCASCAN